MFNANGENVTVISLHVRPQEVMSGDSNPAATPTPCQDTQGDGRWMSLVVLLYFCSFVSNLQP